MLKTFSTKKKSASGTYLPSVTVDLLGRRITCMTVPAIVDSIGDALLADRRLVVAHYNAHGFNLSMLMPWFYEFLQSADITHCDGKGVLKAISSMGLDLPNDYRVTYTQLMPRLLAFCNWHGFSLFLLGGKPETNEQALQHLRQQYSNMHIAGHHGYFRIEDPVENDAVVQLINRVKPDILLVGMGMPRQENWIRCNQSALTVNVIMAGGAVIDRLAGIVPDCPDWIWKLGFEWLYRLGREPRRLGVRYVLGNPVFGLTVLLAKALGHTLTIAPTHQPSQTDLTLPATVPLDFTPDTLPVPGWTTPVLDNSDGLRLKTIGDYLVTLGQLTPSEVEKALEIHRQTGQSVSEILLQRGWLQSPALDQLQGQPSLSEHVA
jgi:N-acetylglucosaminyldiphosphoundecaprenol N-acetyl-beta-D-mannosaminyltransferase